MGFKGVLKKFNGCLRKDSKVFQGYFKEVLRMLQGRLRDILRDGTTTNPRGDKP